MKKAISLIVLVITILILAILATTVMLRYDKHKKCRYNNSFLLCNI